MAAVSAFYRAIGVDLPNCLSLRPYNEQDSEFVDYLERSDVKDKIYIANTPIISSYGQKLVVNPEDNAGIAVEVANATQHYYRPSMKNVQSCHAECQMHRGGQLAYLQNPFWKQITWYKPIAEDLSHPFRTDYTAPVNYRGSYLTDATEFIKVKPYKGRNLLATVNIIPMFDDYGNLYFCLSRAYGDAFVQYGKVIEKILDLHPGVGIALITKSLGNWSAHVADHHLPRVLKPFRETFNLGSKQIYLSSLPAVANFGHDKNNLYRYPDITSNTFLNVFNADNKVVTLVKEKLYCSVLIPSTTGSLMHYSINTSLGEIASTLGLKEAPNVVKDFVKYTSALTDYMVKLIMCSISNTQITEAQAAEYMLSTGEIVTYNKAYTSNPGLQMIYDDGTKLVIHGMQDLVLRVSLRNQLTPTITLGGEYPRTGNYLDTRAVVGDRGNYVSVSEVGFLSTCTTAGKALLATKASGIKHTGEPSGSNQRIYVTYNVKELLEDDDAKVILLTVAHTGNNSILKPGVTLGTCASNWLFVKALGYYFTFCHVTLEDACKCLTNNTDDAYLKQTLSDTQYNAFKMLQRIAKAGRLKEITTATLTAVRDTKSLTAVTLRKASVRMYRGAMKDGAMYKFAYNTAVPIQTEQITEAPIIEDIDDALLAAFGVGEDLVLEEIV
jgi:hypothetical protein